MKPPTKAIFDRWFKTNVERITQNDDLETVLRLAFEGGWDARFFLTERCTHCGLIKNHCECHDSTSSVDVDEEDYETSLKNYI